MTMPGSEEAGNGSKARNRYVLTINGGSSSIKFAVFRFGQQPERLLFGKVERIGLPETHLEIKDRERGNEEKRDIESGDHRSAAGVLIDWLEERIGSASIAAVGHRVVHGGEEHDGPERVTPELLADLKRMSPYDPEHLPVEIALIELFGERFADLEQVACFDTAFHRTLPPVARMLAIPRRFHDKGVRRYGFHGLSYAYVMEELTRVAGAKAAGGRVILAHLGNGASLAAVRGGRSIDTSMGFTPTAGLPMGTRSGDLDPGLVWFLARSEQLTPERFHHMVNHESGLAGISGTSPDMRDLLARTESDDRAAQAVEFFCYQATKWIGAFAAALGGMDTLVFTGGIGEHAGEVRARICQRLAFLGVELDDARNLSDAPVISTAASRATVRVIPTDEELVIARAVARLLSLGDGASAR